jgi:hypothetical protein
MAILLFTHVLHHLMAFMIRGLELESKLEAQPESKLDLTLSPKLDTS